LIDPLVGELAAAFGGDFKELAGTFKAALPLVDLGGDTGILFFLPFRK
jgi:hypothetical protein